MTEKDGMTLATLNQITEALSPRFAAMETKLEAHTNEARTQNARMLQTIGEIKEELKKKETKAVQQRERDIKTLIKVGATGSIAILFIAVKESRDFIMRVFG